MLTFLKPFPGDEIFSSIHTLRDKLSNLTAVYKQTEEDQRREQRAQEYGYVCLNLSVAFFCVSSMSKNRS